jgi:hypothetical protein
MSVATLHRRRAADRVTVIDQYDAAADAKKRISLRHAKSKYYSIKVLSNGSYLLEPRMLVPPQTLSERARRMLEQSAASLKKGVASPPIDLAPFLKA